jgi:hypothetical protein
MSTDKTFSVTRHTLTMPKPFDEFIGELEKRSPVVPLGKAAGPPEPVPVSGRYRGACLMASQTKNLGPHPPTGEGSSVGRPVRRLEDELSRTGRASRCS